MTTVYIVSDPLGISEAFLTFEEGKEKFEKLVAACRQSQKGNPTFRCHFDTVNENGFLSKPDKNKYYCLEDNGILIPITKEELIDGFNSGKLRYLEDCKIEIPGLIGKGISK